MIFFYTCGYSPFVGPATFVDYDRASELLCLAFRITIGGFTGGFSTVAVVPVAPRASSYGPCCIIGLCLFNMLQLYYPNNAADAVFNIFVIYLFYLESHV